MDFLIQFFTQIFELVLYLIDVVLRMDVYLNGWAATMGPWIYVLLFAIIFAETGLVVTPFLPGDSLLFALGALTAVTDAYLSLPLLFVTLTIAGILGDATNYWIGKKAGPKIFVSDTSYLLNRNHLIRTQNFYERYGGKTIVLARFIPIIRTFAPFVAGIGKMKYSRFAVFNVAGAIAWVGIFLFAGAFFGNLPVIKRNFHVVIVAIIIISVAPAVFEWWRERRKPQPGSLHKGVSGET